jgi:uncharacterized damage-inducible protein DinB
MSEVHRIVKQLQRTFQGRAFHGPAVEEALEGVSAKMAAARVGNASHSIWQIVNHMTFWQDTARSWLQGNTRRPDPGEDWTEVKDTSDAAWQETLRKLRRANDELRDEVMVLDESRLEEPIFPQMSKVEVVLHGIIQHNIYHAGQIALLKKLQNSKRS